MAFFGGGCRHTEPCNVGAFQQHTPPLVVAVHGVVYRDVDGPEVPVLVGVKQRRLVFNPLRYTVGQPAVGTVVSSLQPRKCRERFIGEAANIVELERDRPVHLFVGVGIKVWADVKEGWALAVEDKLKRRAVHHKVPVFAGSSLNPKTEFTGQGFRGIEQGVFNLAGG